MDDVWVCGSCKSINRARAERCYSCQGVRDEALHSGGTERRTIDAVANRTVRDYLPSWPLALLAGVLIAAVAVLGVVILVRTVEVYPAMRDAFMAALQRGSGAGLSLSLATSVDTAMLGILRTGLVILALLAFGGWLALATMNVPALGGGYPSRGPMRVFIYTLIPIWNLFKVPAMVQDVLYRLDSTAGGAWMVMAATIGLLGSWFVGWIGGWAIAWAGVRDMIAAGRDRDALARIFGGILDQSMILSIVTEVMVAVGTILVVVLMIRVEQRAARRDREIKDGVVAIVANEAAAAAQPGVVPVAAPGAVVAPAVATMPMTGAATAYPPSAGQAPVPGPAAASASAPQAMPVRGWPVVGQRPTFADSTPAPATPPATDAGAAPGPLPPGPPPPPPPSA